MSEMTQYVYRWMIELQGNTIDLRDFCEMFHDPICQVVELAGELFLCSSQFESCQDAWDVDRQAHELLPLMISVVQVRMGQKSPIVLGKVVHVEDDGSLKRFAFAQASVIGHGRLRATGIVTAHDGTVVESGPSLPQQIVSLALKNRDVGEALRFFSGEHDWTNLYKIHEIIEHRVEKEVFDSWQPGASESFTLSANNPTVSGMQARHSRSKYPKPPKSKGISLSEAEQYVRVLLRRWLDMLIVK